MGARESRALEERDQWQARALAAEAHASRLADALADEVTGRVAAEHDVGRLLGAIDEACSALCGLIYLDVPSLDDKDALKRAQLPVLDSVKATLAATPTSPAAVAALVRAARAVASFTGHNPYCQLEVDRRACDQMGRCPGDHTLPCDCGYSTLAALLDAPPWRDLR